MLYRGTPGGASRRGRLSWTLCTRRSTATAMGASPSSSSPRCAYARSAGSRRRVASSSRLDSTDLLCLLRSAAAADAAWPAPAAAAAAAAAATAVGPARVPVRLRPRGGARP
eukprot:scaffold65696_cov34-Phaeocystis_antarctica.AAC.2